MKNGYAKVSKIDGTQTLNLQIDALVKSCVTSNNIYCDKALGKKDDRPSLANCLKALRKGDIFIGNLTD